MCIHTILYMIKGNRHEASKKTACMPQIYLLNYYTVFILYFILFCIL